MEKQITYEDVLMFLIKNKDDVEMMDDLNRTVYPFTSRYKKKYDSGRGSSTTITEPNKGILWTCVSAAPVYHLCPTIDANGE